MDDETLTTRALRLLGRPDPEVVDRLERYRDWLQSEAIPAGGLGPIEGERIEARHLVDSLLFGVAWDRQATRLVVDVGTGVGLPGIPLAMAHPHREFLLVDRSADRVRLARRAVRVLDLDNVAVERAELARLDLGGTTVVARAVVTPRALLAAFERTGRPAEAVVAGSRREPVTSAGYETVEVGGDILDQPVWFLRMAHS